VLGDVPQPGGHLFTNPRGQLADDRPDRVFRVVRHEGEIETDQLVVHGHELEGFGPASDLLGDPVDLVIEDVTQPLGEDQGQDEILVLRGIRRPSDAARRIPDPTFQRLVAALPAVRPVLRHIGLLVLVDIP